MNSGYFPLVWILTNSWTFTRSLCRSSFCRSSVVNSCTAAGECFPKLFAMFIFFLCFRCCKLVLICKKTSWAKSHSPQTAAQCQPGRRLLSEGGCQLSCWLAWLISLRLYQSDIWSLYAKMAPSNDGSWCCVLAVVGALKWVYLFYFCVLYIHFQKQSIYI